MKTCCFGYALESPAIVRNKTSSCRKTSRRLVTVALTLGLMSTLHAANVLWIGGSTGTWEDATNWSTDPALPGTADNAQLLDVTAGTRTVTIDAPETINQLTITQTTVGAFNVLNVNDDLTISGNTNPFAITATAGQGSIITNIAAGKRLLATKTSQSAPVFNGTLNLAAGSIFELETTGATSDIIAPIINGPVNASGAGAKVIVRPGRFIKNSTTSPMQFNGAVSVTGASSSLAVQRLDASSKRGSAYINFTGNDGSGNSVNLGIGTRMDIDISTGVINFTNRVTLAGESGSDPGAILSFNGTLGGADAVTSNFNGGLVLGEGAIAKMVSSKPFLTLGGVSTFASGSEVLLQYPNRSGGAVFTNNGTLTMDGSALNFDYAHTDTSSNTGGPRNFQNTGTWTLKNGSTVAFTSSTGKATSAYGIGVGNNNSGTLNVESNSKVGFQDLFNTGTMNVGSPTGLAYLGSPDNTFGTVTLTNGVTSAGVDAAGTINVNGNAWLGRTTYIGAITTLNNGSATSVGSVINVGDGTLAATFTMANRDATINNFAGNTFNLNSYATLHLESLGAYPANGNVTLNNNGTFVQAGSLVLQGTWQGARTVATSASGVYRISGANAVLEAKPSIDGTDLSNVPDVIFSVNGQLSGASATDKLTYVNSTGNGARDYLDVAVSGGEIVPGLGSNGSGTSSIGSLEFVDTNITLSGGAKMSFDLGGSGLFDQLTLTLATAGSGAILDLGSDSILDINLVNGFTSVAGTYRIMTADSLTGTFGTLLLNGGANNGEYTVNYLSNGVEVNFGVIPEPATVGLLMGGLVLFVMAGSRRRRTTA